MTPLQVEFTAWAAAQIRALDEQARHRVLAGLTDLEHHPYPSGAVVITGYLTAARFRIDSHRVLYDVNIHRGRITVVGLAAAQSSGSNASRPGS